MCVNVIFSEPYKWEGNRNAPWYPQSIIYCKVCNKKINEGNIVCHNSSSRSYLHGISHSRCARRIEKEIREERALRNEKKLQEAYRKRMEPIPRGDLPSIEAIAEASGIKVSRIREYVSGKRIDEISSLIQNYVEKIGYEKIEQTYRGRISNNPIYFWPGRFFCKVNWDGTIEKKKSCYYLFDIVKKLPNDDRYICYNDWKKHPINHRASYILGETVHGDAFIVSKKDLKAFKEHKPLQPVIIDEIIIPQTIRDNKLIVPVHSNLEISGRKVKIKRRPLEGIKINRAYYAMKKGNKV